MNLEFFEREMNRVEDRFNETFGPLIVCDIRARQNSILAICQMGILARQILRSKDDGEIRMNLKKFHRGRKALHNLFNRMEAEM